MSDDIPLDDLLPTNDACYTPPDSFDQLFERGGAAWELGDVYKWLGLSDTLGNKFISGYMACHFDVMLKSGRSFSIPVMHSTGAWVTDLFIRRAAMFNRQVRVTSRSVQGHGATYLTVSAHGE